MRITTSPRVGARFREILDVDVLLKMQNAALVHSGRDEMLLLSFSLDDRGALPTKTGAPDSLAVPPPW